MVQTRTGTPIGNLANSLIQSAWDKYSPGLPAKKKGPGRPIVREYEHLHNMLIGLPTGIEPDSSKDATGLSDAEIRKFADEHEITRLVIETCKDQLCKLRWTFRLKPKEGKTSFQIKEESEKDERILQLNKFFKKPDRFHDFYQWLRMLLEEFMVVDTVVTWKQETLLDKLYAIYLLDKTSIKTVINKMGVPPDPDLDYPENVAYQQIIKNEVLEEFTTNELIYYIRNPRVWAFEGYSPVEQIILTLSTGMRRMAMQLYHYTDGNVPSMFLRAPKEWTLDQIKEFQLYWNALLAGNYGELAKGWMIPGDVEPIFPQKETLKDEFDEWVARVVCYAFSVSPNAFIKNLNRATSEQAREQADEEGLQSRMMLVKRLIDRIQEQWFGYEDIEFHLIYDRPQDSLKQSEIDNVDIRNGSKSVDEVRRERGFAPIGAPNRMYTNDGWLAMTEDDEDKFDIFRQQMEKPPGGEPEKAPPTNS